MRAVAVLPVIFYHAGFAGFSGGFVGVDVFFVISGYLITTIILDEHEDAGFSYGTFYERRMRRLLPALFVVMAACLIPAWIWLLPADLETFAHSLGFVSIFASNFYFFENIDYFSGPAEEMPLLHTWSLAVEEQFYIVFPLLLLFLWRFSMHARLVVLSGLFLASLLLAHRLSGTSPAASFFLLPTRFWELLAGAGCAIWIRSNRPAAHEWLASSGIVLIILAIVFFSSTTLHPSALTLAPVVGTCLVILFALPQTATAKILSHPLPVGIGLISYAAYLWHQPLFAFARVRSLTEPSVAQMSALSCMALLLAWATWRFVEKPIRRRELPWFASRRLVFSASAIGALAFVALGIIGELNDGFGQRYDQMRIASFEPNNRVLQQASWEPLRQASGIPTYREDGRAFENQPWFGEDDGRPGLLIVGNSHAKDLFNTLVESRSIADGFQVYLYLLQLNDLASADSPIYATPNFDHAMVVLIAPRYSDADLGLLGDVIETLQDHGKVVGVVLNTPEFSGDLTTNLADSIVFPRLRRGDTPDPAGLAAEINEAYRDDLSRNWNANNPNSQIAAIAQERGALVLDRRAYICPSTCLAVGEDLAKYIYDYGHVSLEGAKAYGRVIDQIDWFAPVRDVLPFR